MLRILVGLYDARVAHSFLPPRRPPRALDNALRVDSRSSGKVPTSHTREAAAVSCAACFSAAAWTASHLHVDAEKRIRGCDTWVGRLASQVVKQACDVGVNLPQHTWAPCLKSPKSIPPLQKYSASARRRPDLCL